MSSKDSKILTEVVHLGFNQLLADICDKLNTNENHFPPGLWQSFLVCKLNLGIYSKENPLALVEEVTDHALKNQQNLSAVLLNGDFVKHKVALSPDQNATDQQMNQTWETIKSNMKITLDLMRRKFPELPILPVIGNNDVIVHDQMPCSAEWKERYFSELFELWFPKNSVGVNRAKIQSTFL